MTKILVGLLAMVPFVGLILAAWIISIQANNNYIGHLERAATANTIEIAKTELSVSVTYLKNNKMTDGYTSAIYRTPDEDVGYWYKNLDASLAGLNAAAARTEMSELERSNILLKLRETLQGHGSEGTYVIHPDGISRYPNNGLWSFFFTVTGVLALVGFILVTIGLNE